jgi:homoserine O-acetyltransferase/O-succinyltransferase
MLTYRITNHTMQNGAKVDVDLAYKTYGLLNKAKDNAILIPTFFGGKHLDTEYMLAPGRAIDTKRYFVIIVNMLGNGLSSSPSNTPPPYHGKNFPLITLYDNVICQHELVTQALGINELKLVAGFSMGAQQAFQWGSLFPRMVKAIAPICGAAKISDHNKIFIDSAIGVLKIAPDFNEGDYENPPLDAINAFGHVYAAWLFSQDFFRERLYKKIGLETSDAVVKFTQNYFQQSDANDLIAMATTWANSNISANKHFNNDFEGALQAITCRAIVLPGTTDLYFRVADNLYEVETMPNAELRPIPSSWGHAAGFGANNTDNVFIDKALAELLA